MIATGNQNFDAWGEVFEERVIATAIPDMRSIMQTPSISGENYLRLKVRLESNRSTSDVTRGCGIFNGRNRGIPGDLGYSTRYMQFCLPPMSGLQLPPTGAAKRVQRETAW